jgi:hypothetical protein
MPVLRVVLLIAWSTFNIVRNKSITAALAIKREMKSKE